MAVLRKTPIGQTRIAEIDGLRSCHACSVRGAHTVAPVPGYGTTPNRVMLLSQMPGREENERGIPFVGGGGKYLRDVMASMNWPLDSIYRTNVVHCWPINGRKLDTAEIRTCSKLFLEKEIRLCDPDIILAMGDVPYRALLPEEKSGIMAVQGAVFEREIFGRKRYIVPMQHPVSVMSNTVAHEPAFRAALEIARSVRDGEYQKPSFIPFRTTEASWSEIMQTVKNADRFGFDLETDSIDRWSKIVGIGIAAEYGNGLYYPTDNNIEARERINELKPFLQHYGIQKEVSNVKFERHVLSGYGITLRNYGDTLLRAWVLGDQPLGLKDGFHRATGVEMIRIDKFNIPKYRVPTWRALKYGIKATAMSMRLAQIHDRAGVTEYAAQDPDASLRLADHYDALLEQRPALYNLYHELELPFVEILIEMERNGFRFDPRAPGLQEFRKRALEAFGEAESKVATLLGYPINTRSTTQKQIALYLTDTPYKLPEPRRPRDADPNKLYLPTDKVSLADHVGDNPLVRSILTAGAAWKLYGSATALPTWVESDGKIHTELRQNVAATGRLSSNNPNLQNIPARQRSDTEIALDGAILRLGFVADRTLCSCCKALIYAPDLSQIEMRIAAHLSGDREMIRLLRAGADLHDNTTVKIFKKTEKDVSAHVWKNMRFLAKTIGFGVLYGLTALGLIARTPGLNLSLSEAEEFIAGFYNIYADLIAWQHSVIEFTRKNGYAETLLGRRRYIPEITSNNIGLRNEAERQAINVPVQGSAADYFKLCILGVDKFLRREELTTRLVCQVHDEIVMEGPMHEREIIEANVPAIMSTAIKLDVPVKVDMEWGTSWGDLATSSKWAKRGLIPSMVA